MQLVGHSISQVRLSNETAENTRSASAFNKGKTSSFIAVAALSSMGFAPNGSLYLCTVVQNSMAGMSALTLSTCRRYLTCSSMRRSERENRPFGSVLSPCIACGSIIECGLIALNLWTSDVELGRRFCKLHEHALTKAKHRRFRDLSSSGLRRIH